MDVDGVLADSFPASDPPSWTLGVARPAPNGRPAVLAAGSQIPRFNVRTLEGNDVAYASIWQRKNLVLITVPAVEPAGSSGSLSQITARLLPLIPADTACVITRDTVTGIPSPGVVVADRWGEIVHVAAASTVADLPSVPELVEWVDYVRHQCPECQGEAK